MNWAVFCGIALFVLTIAVLGNSVEVRTDVYFSSSKWYPPDYNYNYSYPLFIPFVNISNLGSIGNNVKSYCVADSQITDAILVSDSTCSIKSWAENILNNNFYTYFYVVFDNQTYIITLSSTRTLESQIYFNEALFIITIGMWATLLYFEYRDRRKEEKVLEEGDKILGLEYPKHGTN